MPFSWHGVIFWRIRHRTPQNAFAAQTRLQFPICLHVSPTTSDFAGDRRRYRALQTARPSGVVTPVQIAEPRTPAHNESDSS